MTPERRRMLPLLFLAAALATAESFFEEGAGPAEEAAEGGEAAEAPAADDAEEAPAKPAKKAKKKEEEA